MIIFHIIHNVYETKYVYKNKQESLKSVCELNYNFYVPHFSATKIQIALKIQ